MAQIFFNEKINEYTLFDKILDVKSIKKIPMKFKLTDKTSRFRKELLREEIFK